LEGEDVILTLNPKETEKSFLKSLLQEDIELTLFAKYLPSLQEIFIEKAGDHIETA
jgi:ABC-2 type transport system ATP-binding protein